MAQAVIQLAQAVIKKNENKIGTRHGDFREKKEIRQKQVNKRQEKDRDKIRVSLLMI